MLAFTDVLSEAIKEAGSPLGRLPQLATSLAAKQVAGNQRQAKAGQAKAEGHGLQAAFQGLIQQALTSLQSMGTPAGTQISDAKVRPLFRLFGPLWLLFCHSVAVGVSLKRAFGGLAE